MGSRALREAPKDMDKKKRKAAEQEREDGVERQARRKAATAASWAKSNKVDAIMVSGLRGEPGKGVESCWNGEADSWAASPPAVCLYMQVGPTCLPLSACPSKKNDGVIR
ncbi:hypothetical protein NMY22_g12077 [Coprinellus aureogranulatus]|nr:hypothetical protein NMY22_g12077 [Coprinellus aureogranulatus]